MNSVEINRIFKKILPRDRVKFLGVLPHDHARSLLTSTTYSNPFPLCFVSNTHPSTKPGEHWVAFYLTAPDSLEFFDSYGLPPSVYEYDVTPASSNPHTLQQLDSKVCGQYCVYYLYHRCRGKVLTQILAPFSLQDKAWNDHSVASYVSNLTSSVS